MPLFVAAGERNSRCSSKSWKRLVVQSRPRSPLVDHDRPALNPPVGVARRLPAEERLAVEELDPAIRQKVLRQELRFGGRRAALSEDKGERGDQGDGRSPKMGRASHGG
jgi:hypothetical protein